MNLGYQSRIIVRGHTRPVPPGEELLPRGGQPPRGICIRSSGANRRSKTYP
jgi:hypothetical protein